MTHRSARLALVLLLAGVVSLAFEPTLRVAAAKKPSKKLTKLIKRTGLAKLPSAANALAGRKKARKKRLQASVSGTPPALVQVPNLDITSLFWRAGVVGRVASGTPTPDDCNEFFGDGPDGTSGGFGACHLTESVGRSFGAVADGETSLCYMKRFPTQANLDAGGVQIVSGTLPDGGIEQLFAPPAGAARIVKALVSGEGAGPQEIFLRVASQTENTAAGNLYGVDIWFCGGGVARGFNTLTVSRAGRFRSIAHEHNQDDGGPGGEGGDGGPGDGGPQADGPPGGGGTHKIEVEGYVTSSGNVVAWDLTRPRTAHAEFTHGDGGGFKAAIEITPANRVVTKAYDTFGGGSRKLSIHSTFSGGTPTDVRFLAGGFKEAGDGIGNQRTGGVEFRDTYYASAPDSALKDDAAAVDFASDPFYATPASSDIDASAYSCTTAADVVLTLDMANPAVARATAPCSQRPFDGMHFCFENQAVRAAEQAFQGSCGH